ncbi:Carboxylate/amino_acid/amine transporter family protein [Hexamita inflata]|uniref:Carboxylate/amino acid/amine transporter family protein n=1 Tax=Hexamita inflata TaxID=28002 RepID=A0AA86PBI6_9EUKA|nr:Carboxylate/amino acid/amine transporter family protein [Hexamita inflata]
MQGIKLLIFSQVLCISSSASGIILQIINTTYATNLPFTVGLALYLFQLCTLLVKQKRQKVQMKKMLQIFSLGFLDCINNSCNALAFKYSDVASITLILSLLSPFSIIFGSLILKAKYNFKQISCAFVTCCFAIIFTLIDAQSSQNKDKWIGNLLASACALGMALESTINQRLSQDIPTLQYASMLAVGGFSFSLILTSIFEFKHYVTVPYESFCLMLPTAMLALLTQFMMIYITQRASAVNCNISILCGNFYTFLASIFIFRTGFNFLQAFPAIGIIISVALYFVVDAEQQELSQQAQVIEEDIESGIAQYTDE